MTADVTADASSTSLARSVLVARYPQPSGRPPPSSICTAPLLPEFTPCAPRTQRHTREYTCKISLKCYGGSCAPHHTPLHPTLPRSLRRAAPVQKPAVALVKPDRTALIDIYQAQYTHFLRRRSSAARKALSVALHELVGRRVMVALPVGGKHPLMLKSCGTNFQEWQ